MARMHRRSKSILTAV
ncbi:hypothetical protein AKJ16_DCAP05557 [Drosera capensis]